MMSTDDQFVADLERAARNLRSAASSALICGLTPQQIARIVTAGVEDVRSFQAVGRSRARVAAIGYTPTAGQPLPEPSYPETWTSSGDSHGRPGDDDFRPPSIHPCVRRNHAA